MAPEVSPPDVRMIPIDLINLPIFNSRIPKVGEAVTKEQENFEQLKASIAERGQLQAGLVEGPDDAGHFLLVYGSRRLQACMELDATHYKAEVRPLTSDLQRMEDNGIENLRRSNLTAYEEARFCLALREGGKTSKEIEEVVGFSASKARNLMVCFAELPDPIKIDWQQEHPAADSAFLRELATKKNYPTPDSQVAAWEERKAALAKAVAEGAPKRAPNKTKVAPEHKVEVDQEALKAVLIILAHKKCPKKLGGTSAWAQQLMRYICGTVPTMPRDMLELLDLTNPPKAKAKVVGKLPKKGKK
jgi:ParB/RepB/Spo0J family partition protein